MNVWFNWHYVDRIVFFNFTVLTHVEVSPSRAKGERTATDGEGLDGWIAGSVDVTDRAAGEIKRWLGGWVGWMTDDLLRSPDRSRISLCWTSGLILCTLR